MTCWEWQFDHLVVLLIFVYVFCFEAFDTWRIDVGQEFRKTTSKYNFNDSLISGTPIFVWKDLWCGSWGSQDNPEPLCGWFRKMEFGCETHFSLKRDRLGVWHLYWVQNTEICKVAYSFAWTGFWINSEQPIGDFKLVGNYLCALAGAASYYSSHSLEPRHIRGD